MFYFILLLFTLNVYAGQGPSSIQYDYEDEDSYGRGTSGRHAHSSINNSDSVKTPFSRRWNREFEQLEANGSKDFDKAWATVLETWEIPNNARLRLKLRQHNISPTNKSDAISLLNGCAMEKGEKWAEKLLEPFFVGLKTELSRPTILGTLLSPFRPRSDISSSATYGTLESSSRPSTQLINVQPLHERGERLTHLKTSSSGIVNNADQYKKRARKRAAQKIRETEEDICCRLSLCGLNIEF